MSANNSSSSNNNNKSFQLPDLVALIESLELRTNRHCKHATDDSAAWAAKELAMTDHAQACLASAKIGLLAGICFPKCDMPQLCILMDFMTLLFYSALIEEEGGMESVWQESLDAKEGVSALETHGILKGILPRLVPFLARAPEEWHSNFANSVYAFRSSQRALTIRAPGGGSHPASIDSIDAYLALRRELHGVGMVLALAELLEVVAVPEIDRATSPAAASEALDTLRQTALDIIALSTDVAAYCRQSANATNVYPNAVSILMRTRTLSVQGAVNVIGGRLRDTFSRFKDAASQVCNAFTSRPPRGGLAWIWGSGAGDMNPASAEAGKNAERYVTALGDCIVGVVHWVYETELFFGVRGGEIRSFGWVFVDDGGVGM